MAARRLRGDLIETFKLLHGYTNINYEIFFKLNITTETQGHNWKLFKPQTTKGLQCRVNFFSLMVINAWNKLPCNVVSATSTNQFKPQLDHYWIKNGYGFSQAQCLLYTYKPISVSVKILYKTYIRTNLEFVIQAWSPYLDKYIKVMEKIQRQATKMVLVLRHLQYEGRLKKLV